MQVDSFELAEQTTFEDFHFPFRVVIRGSGLDPRAVPFDARFGEADSPADSVIVWALMPTLDGALVGFLDETPALDAELHLGYLGEPLVATGLDPRIPA
jgi:hypothetical protein